MNTTRSADLELLELARDGADSEQRLDRRNAILESVYQQTKDSTLEKIRTELAKWINFGLANVPEEGVPPTPKQIQAMGKAEQKIQELERKAQAYVKTPGFQNELLKRMARHDKTAVDSIINQQKRRVS